MSSLSPVEALYSQGLAAAIPSARLDAAVDGIAAGVFTIAEAAKVLGLIASQPQQPSGQGSRKRSPEAKARRAEKRLVPYLLAADQRDQQRNANRVTARTLRHNVQHSRKVRWADRLQGPIGDVTVTVDGRSVTLDAATPQGPSHDPLAGRMVDGQLRPDCRCAVCTQAKAEKLAKARAYQRNGFVK